MKIQEKLTYTNISIHALRGEGDDNFNNDCRQILNISIHALRGEGDKRSCCPACHRNYFNPRPPWGGRPWSGTPETEQYSDFNPRPPWGGRPPAFIALSGEIDISIHALRGEGDRKVINITAEYIYFNPRPPWGGRRDTGSGTIDYTSISIHALRGEGDSINGITDIVIEISIHALRGEGDRKNSYELSCWASFQSTPSVGRATCNGGGQYSPPRDFNPRPPWGGRLLSPCRIPCRTSISIHALRGEGDTIPAP